MVALVRMHLSVRGSITEPSSEYGLKCLAWYPSRRSSNAINGKTIRAKGGAQDHLLAYRIDEIKMGAEVFEPE